MNKITMDLIEKVYELGKTINEGTLQRSDANLQLVELGMNEKSANMYLTCICALLNETHYGSTVNATATDYFMKNILADFGKERLSSALKVLREHINYQEGKNKLPSLHQVLDKYDKLIG